MLTGGLGADSIDGGGGPDFVVWTVGDGIDTQVLGGGGTEDALQLFGTTADENVVLAVSGKAPG